MIQPTSAQLIAAISALFAPGNVQSLGLKPAPAARSRDILYIKSQEGGDSCWYRLVEDARTGKPKSDWLDPIACASLQGNLIDLELVEVPGEEFGDKIKFQMSFDVGTGTPILVRSGMTLFTESVIRALDSAASIKQPLCIHPKKADEEKVVFVNVFNGSGELLLTDAARSPRLITWSKNDKPSNQRAIELFLPALNRVRVKLGLAPSAGAQTKRLAGSSAPGPTDRHLAARSAGNTGNLAAVPNLPATTLARIVQLIDRLTWTTTDVVGCLKQNFQVERISALQSDDADRLIGILEMALVAHEEIPF